MFGTYATSSHAELGGHAGGWTVVTPMWGGHLSNCLFAVLLWMIDSCLKRKAWHNHLPSRVVTHIQSWTLTFHFFFFLFISFQILHLCVRVFYTPLSCSVLLIMIMMIKIMINDYWGVFFPPQPIMTFYTFYNYNTLTLSPTIPTIHSPASFTEATQISHGRSMKAQPLQDVSQDQGINHSPEQELWQA